MQIVSKLSHVSINMLPKQIALFICSVSCIYCITVSKLMATLPPCNVDWRDSILYIYMLLSSVHETSHMGPEGLPNLNPNWHQIFYNHRYWTLFLSPKNWVAWFLFWLSAHVHPFSHAITCGSHPMFFEIYQTFIVNTYAVVIPLLGSDFSFANA